MKLKKSLTILAVLTLFLGTFSASAKSPNAAVRMTDFVWADGKIFDSIITATSFDAPPMHSLDKLYNFGGSGLTGQRLVSEAGPGNPNYNGGRWVMVAVTFNFPEADALDADMDGEIDNEITSEAQILELEDMGYLTTEYVDPFVPFVCPLVSGRGNR